MIRLLRSSIPFTQWAAVRISVGEIKVPLQVPVRLVQKVTCSPVGEVRTSALHIERRQVEGGPPNMTLLPVWAREVAGRTRRQLRARSVRVRFTEAPFRKMRATGDRKKP